MAGEELGDVAGALHVVAERVALADQPVRRQEVRAVMAPQEDDPLAQAQGLVEVLATGDEEHGRRAMVGDAVEEQVAGPPADLIPRQVPAHRRDIPLAAELITPTRHRRVVRGAEPGEQGIFRTADARDQSRRDRQRQGAEDRQDRTQQALAHTEPTPHHVGFPSS